MVSNIELLLENNCKPLKNKYDQKNQELNERTNTTGLWLYLKELIFLSSWETIDDFPSIYNTTIIII